MFATPVSVLQEVVSVEEFYEWMARDRHIAPIGERRADRRFAVLARVMFATLGVDAKVEGLMAEMAAASPVDGDDETPAPRERKPASPDLLAKNALAQEKFRQAREAKNNGNARAADPAHDARQ